MKNSEQRISFISEYISGYKSKIRLLNSEGLFDSAKLFEVFAIEVGSLYFKQRLSNLNIGTYTYPAVDLIAEDKSFFVQVSTGGNIPTKIKSTLEKIQNSEIENIRTIKNVKFFVLDNESCEKVKDLVGNDKIGDIEFVKDRDLVTTKTILEKAISDINFQIDLYELLLCEEQSIKDNLLRLKDAIEDSRVSLNNIESKINGEYEIDRDVLITHIKKDNYKNISIQGMAGSGKSVLCKKLIENEDNVLFARAERFSQETNINDIWGFNVRDTLKCLGEKELVIFIDSLESISDNRSKLDLLSILYDCTKEYPLVKVVTSCRSNDKAAFIKLEGNYDVYSYELTDLNQSEVENIANQYPIINQMKEVEAYKEFLASPFYINIIVTEMKDFNSIKDENEFRNYIWKNVICKRGQEFKETIKKIVFDRATTFSVGVNPDDYNRDIIAVLISDGILIKNLNTVRLKYDIFEDICFEYFFDVEFDKCRGDYNEFFKAIEAFGGCVYRRYQIWIENKLLAKSNRDKFLFQLNFSDKTPLKWKKRTRIGLVKSRHSQEFFDEYGSKIIKDELLTDFIRCTNLYAFQINGKSLPDYVIQLNPTGVGRKCLIHLIAKNKWYENNKTANSLIIKLCADYVGGISVEQGTAEECVEILGGMIHRYLSDTSSTDYYKVDEIINKLLAPIYRIANYATSFIEEFWGQMQQWYKSGEHEKISLSRDIIEYALKSEHFALAKYMPKQLCGLAEFFWTFTPRLGKEFPPDIMQAKEDILVYWYGLSRNAENYEYGESRGSALHKTFFLGLFRNHFWSGLDWAIHFINRTVEALRDGIEEELPTYTICFTESNTNKVYLGYERLWTATNQEYSVPLLISDLIYCLKYAVREIVNIIVADKDALKTFTTNLKNEIFNKSNNIGLLTVISETGMEFEKILPGYALDITSNIDLVIYDLTRKLFCLKNPTREQLERQVFLSVGIPFGLSKRYNNFVGDSDLIEYFLRTYITGDEKIKEKCSNILDYLYSIIPNNEEYATQYLQIQKMDLRSAQLGADEKGNIYVQPQVSGAAKTLTEKPIFSDLDIEITALMNKCGKSIENKTISAKELVETIYMLSNKIKSSSMSFSYENLLIGFIAYAFTLNDLKDKDRRELCQIWINGIYKIIRMGSFNIEVNAVPILLKQIDYTNDAETKNAIKKLILDCILYNGQNGIIAKISHLAHNFIYENSSLEKCFFNTIAMLAQDQMRHEKYNAKYLKEFKEISKKERVFIPNRQPSLKGIDEYLEKKGGEKYADNKQKIIQECLYEEKETDFSNFDMQNYDIALMSYALNCKKSLLDSNISSIVEKYMTELINMFKDTEHSHNRHNFFNSYHTHEIKALLQRDFLSGGEKTENLLNIMFDKMDFSKFNQDTIELYQEVFAELFMFYFDAHNNIVDREKSEEIIYRLEAKVTNITDEYAQKELYKSLILSLPRYAGMSDISECPSGYSYRDKQFLNDIFSKYGGYHLDELLATIYKLHMDKLLPEIIISLGISLQKHIELCSETRRVVEIKYDWILLLIATKIFLDHSSQIKGDIDLRKAYENILGNLRDLGYAQAAVMLDEFRLH